MFFCAFDPKKNVYYNIGMNVNYIYLVRRLQRSLALAYRHPNLTKYTDRDSVAAVTDQLANKFFPLAVRRGHMAADQVRDMYRYWLVAAPVSDKVMGYWRPWWTRQVFNSWLRQHINNKNKPRYWLGWLPWNWNQELSTEPGARLFNVFDDNWLAELAEYITQSSPDTARGQLARQLTGPFVWAQEAKELLETCRGFRSGLWWWEDGAIVLSNQPWEYPGMEWYNLYEQSVDLLKYRLSTSPDGYLNVEMTPQTIQDLKFRIRRILDSSANPEHKLHLVNRYVTSWYSVAKYAYQARPQARELESWIWKRVSKQILATQPNLKGKYFNLKEASWVTKLAYQKRDNLLELDRQNISDELWKMFWKPRR